MYVNIGIADETCTNCALIGPRLQQGRYSDAWLPKRCSSKNSQRPSYRYLYGAARTRSFFSTDQAASKAVRTSSQGRKVYIYIRLSCTVLCYQIRTIDRVPRRLCNRAVVRIDWIEQVKYFSLNFLPSMMNSALPKPPLRHAGANLC